VKSHITSTRAAVLLACLALLLGISITASSAATGTGWIGLGNLSASPTPVDVYLYSGGNSSPQFVRPDVSYGTILPYQVVNAGDYRIQMRTAGSSPSSTPVWAASLTVKPGGTYLAVALRTSTQQGHLMVIDNDLTTPKGKSSVRVIQADINQNKVTFHCSCASGAKGDITTDAAPGTVSMQAPIPPGPSGGWTMTATGPTATASMFVPLTAGSVHTEIVLETRSGGIAVLNEVDAVGAGQAPTGGASTGFGGTAPRPAGSSLLWLALIGGGALLILAGGWRLGRSRLRRLTTS
jgi:hypothetical protein